VVESEPLGEVNAVHARPEPGFKDSGVRLELATELKCFCCRVGCPRLVSLERSMRHITSVTKRSYVFDVSQTDGAELPTMREMRGTVGDVERI
jgi:hypothetical protein